MTKSQQKSFRILPVAAAVGVALGAMMSAQAATLPAANLPVNGTVVAGGLASSGAITSSGSIGDFGGTSQASGTLTITNSTGANTVITWGAANPNATLNTNASYAGFNIAGTVGTVAASTVNFSGGGTVLNVDTSGNASMLNGVLTGTDTNVFVANANGIIVGSGAQFDVGTTSALALIAGNIAGLSSMGTNSTFSSFGIDFASASQGVTVNDGATFTAGQVVIAGAGTVNVTDTAPANSGLNLVLVGGVAGNLDTSGTFNKATIGSFSNGTVAVTYALANAGTTAVNLNLGHLTTATQAAQVFTFGTGSALYATGDINNGSTSNINLGTVAQEWGGTFTNNGSMAVTGTIGGSTGTPSSFDFVNAGVLNVATNGLTAYLGGSFNNTGTILLTTASSATSNINVNVNNSITLGGTVSGSLGAITLVAGSSSPSQGVAVNTALAASDNVTMAGFNVAVTQNVSTKTDAVISVGAGAANSAVGSFSLASTAALTANPSSGNVAIVYNSPLAPANASIGGTISANTVSMALNTVNVGGNIATNFLGLSLTGDINKANGGGTAANNYLDNAALVTQLSTTAPVSVSLGANGNHIQRFNIKVKGDASVTSTTSNFASSGINNGGNTASPSFSLPAANQLSQLRLQTTGNLFVTGGSGLGISPAGSFTWPGLTVLMAGGNLISNAAIDNALGASVPGGNGIFLQGKTLQLNAPVYTSGNAWINFLQTGFGTATTTSPLNMTSYYVATEPSNTSTGVNSYVPTPAQGSQLKLGRAYVTSYVPQ